MIHTVHLLLGAEFKQACIDLKKYVVKYGEGNASSYFTTLIGSLQNDNSIRIDNAELQTAKGTGVFYSGLENLYQVELKTGKHIISDEEMKSFFSSLYTKTVTIDNPGDSNSIHLCIYLPLYDDQSWSVAQRIIRILNGGIQYRYKIDLLGIAADMAPLFFPAEKADNLQINFRTMNKMTREIVAMKEKGHNFDHFILMQNCNARGVSLNFTHNSFIQVVGELALLYIEHYTVLFPVSAEFDKQEVVAFGLSILNLDKYYFVHYLLRKAYLHVMEKEQVMQKVVDVNKVSLIVQKCLKNQTNLFSNFYEQEVEPLLKKEEKHEDIIAAVAPKLDSKIEELSEDFQSFIYDENLTLPEKQAAMAQLLGVDDDLFKGYLFNKRQLTLADCDIEAANLFIEENNKLIKRYTDEEGREQVIPAVLTNPEDKEKKIYLPLDKIKDLRIKMRESTNYIRQKSEELSSLSQQLEDEEASKKRLTEDGFIYEGTLYKLHDIEEKPLTETYQGHPVSEKSIDLRKKFTNVKNQGSQGSCTAFAVSSIYEYILKKSSSTDYDLSEAFVYYNVREKNNQITEDTGSSLYDVISSITTKGICLEKLCPYNPNDFTICPGNEAYADALQRLIKEAKNVNLKIDDFKSALSDGYPIAVSMKIYDSFGNNHSGFIFRPTDKEVKNGKYGNHAMVVCGYSDDERVFIVRNSWGKDFGDKGYCYIPYSYMEDAELTNMACIITQVSSEVKVAGADHKTTVSFNKTDNSIRCSIMRILIDEEKQLLNAYQRIYTEYRIAYDTLMEMLGNNSIRERIYNMGCERLETNIDHLKLQEENCINKERPEALAKYDKAARSKSMSLAIPAVVMLLFTLSTFYFEEFDKGTNWWVFGSCIALSLFLFLYASYKKHHRKKLEEELEEHIIHIANQRYELKKQRDTLHLKLHLAGMVIDKLATLQNRFMKRYLSLKSYVGNLSVWYEEESKKVKEMSAFTEVPFLSLLSNEMLDTYFEENKEKIVGNIKLYKYFNGYNLSENTIIRYKESIRQRLIDKLFSSLDDFTIYDFIIEQKTYPYLDSEYVVPSKSLSLMNEKSEVFLQNEKKDVTEDTYLTQHLFIYTATQSEYTKWEQEYPKHFRLRPSSNSAVSVFKLVVVQERRLNLNEIKMLNLL